MSSMEGTARQSSPFDGLPTFRFFYRNLANREVLAALRYGIDARKGLLLFTGEVGTGKTALIEELARAADPKLVVIPISDPRIDFSDLLALILGALDVEFQSEDQASRIRSCQAALRSGLEASRIVALTLDDAQNLADETIEALARHFLGKGFDQENNLLQIVLAGRPELRERLMRPPLRSLPTQIEIACRLTPLRAKDVEHYIRHRLEAAAWTAQMFDDDAIGLIAGYSGGYPSIVNAICKRALELEDACSGTEITSDTVVRAARELDIEMPGGQADKTGTDESRQDALDDPRRPCSVVAHGDFSDPPESAARPSSPPRAARRTVSAWLMLLFITALAARLDGVPVLSYGRSLGEKLGELGEFAVLPPRSTAPAGTSSRLPAAGNRFPAGARPRGDAPTATKPAMPRGDPAQESPETNQDRPAKSAQPPTPAARKPAPQTGETERLPQQDLTKAVSRAIENRAILGVRVSVVDRVAYLDGRVATRNQKDIAERAARAVPGVREVQNRITID